VPGSLILVGGEPGIGKSTLSLQIALAANGTRYENAFANHHVDIEFYTARKRPDDEVFPWEHLDVGVSRGFLLQEWHKAQEGKTTGNCRMQCSGCGSATYGGGVCFEAKN